jgi:hypothetical protein
MSSREKAPIEEHVVRASNLDAFRIQVGERGEGPFIRAIGGMERPLRSNPTYSSENRQEENKSCYTPQRDLSKHIAPSSSTRRRSCPISLGGTSACGVSRVRRAACLFKLRFPAKHKQPRNSQMHYLSQLSAALTVMGVPRRSMWVQRKRSTSTRSRVQEFNWAARMEMTRHAAIDCFR